MGTAQPLQGLQDEGELRPGPGPVLGGRSNPHPRNTTLGPPHPVLKGSRDCQEVSEVKCVGAPRIRPGSLHTAV